MFKEKKGVTGIDIVLAIIMIILFTSIIFSLMYNIKLQSVMQVYKLSSNIFMTQTMENIGIANYDNIVSTNSSVNNELIPELPSGFTEQISVENIENQEDLIKKVTVTISYTIGNRKYENIAQRLKIKQ